MKQSEIPGIEISLVFRQNRDLRWDSNIAPFSLSALQAECYGILVEKVSHVVPRGTWDTQTIDSVEFTFTT